MIDQISRRQADLDTLCRRHGVRTLELFGSATSGEFQTGRSDLDFLVDFHSTTPGRHAKAYFGLLFDLKDLFQCDVDLVEVRAVTNPYFVKKINTQRETIYADRDSEISA